jgi:multidrug resistance efflux pump
VARLAGAGLAPDADLERARGEARARRASAEALALAVGRLEEDRRAEEGERRARLAELESQAVQLQGEAGVEDARLARLAHQARERSIRASVDGRVGEAADLRPGTVVRAGERLGSLVPAGTLRVVAFFPVTSLGRVRARQEARVRLAGFPWTEYGRLRARVAHVAPEPRDGRFRVELVLENAAASRVPLAHGLPGSVEVEVERVSPASLVLRSVGRARAPAPPPAGAAR